MLKRTRKIKRNRENWTATETKQYLKKQAEKTLATAKRNEASENIKYVPDPNRPKTWIAVRLQVPKL